MKCSGIDARTVTEISAAKGEPRWMRELRLKSLDVYGSSPVPRWGADLSQLNVDSLDCFQRATDHKVSTWQDLPEEMRGTYERLGVAAAERDDCARVQAQYDSEMVYGSVRQQLARQGIIFTDTDTDTALREHPEIVRTKSIARDGGRSTFRGRVQVLRGSRHAKSQVRCDSLILDANSRCDTYPFIEVRERDAAVGHEASVSRIAVEQLFYLMSRGLSESEASQTIVLGFIEPLLKELPMCYAVPLNRLIPLEMSRAVG
jgi:Fe-S cluster assembly scaffold protein SufB